MRPQIILEILANLQNHNALQGHGFGTLLHQQFGLVDFANQVRVQLLLLPRRRCFAARQPVRLRNLRQPVALNLRQSDAARNGTTATRGYITYRFGLRRRRNRVLGDAVAAEIICPRPVNLGHDGCKGRGSSEIRVLRVKPYTNQIRFSFVLALKIYVCIRQLVSIHSPLGKI